MSEQEIYHNIALFLNRVSVTGSKEAEIYLGCLNFCLKRAQGEEVVKTATKTPAKRTRKKAASTNGRASASA